MLDLGRISHFAPHTEAWWKHRIGTMSSSKIHVLCGDKGLGKEGLTYITNKVHEKLTGKSLDTPFDTAATAFGVENEPLSLKGYAEKYDCKTIIVSKHIIYNELFSGTPDWLVINKILGDQYDCETVESKSYPTRHLQMIECNTPLDIKAVDKPLFWQVISQMMFADVTVGNATFFHPDFKGESKQQRVVFKKIELLDYFKLLKARMDEATAIYNKLYNKWK